MKRAYFMIYLCLLALCLSGCSCAKRTEERWNEQYDVGMQYLLEGDYQEAILAFTATIEIDPMRPESYLERAAVYLELGDDASIEAAVADYQKAVELEPTNGQTYVLLAQTYLRQGNYEQAVNTLHEGQAAASEHAAIDAELKKLQLYVDFNDPHYAPYFLNKTGAELEAAGFVIGYETDYDFYGNGLPIDWIETYGIFLQGLPSMRLNMRGDSSFATAQESWVAYIELVPGEGDEVGILPGISWDLSYEELKEYMGTQLPLYRTEIARYDDSVYTGYYCALQVGDTDETKLDILIFWENIEDILETLKRYGVDGNTEEAVNELIAQYKSKFVGGLGEAWDTGREIILEKGAEVAFDAATGGLYSIVDLSKDVLLEFGGINDQADATEMLLGSTIIENNVFNAYTEALDVIKSGDFTENDATDLQMMFDMYKAVKLSKYESALQIIEKDCSAYELQSIKKDIEMIKQTEMNVESLQRLLDYSSTSSMIPGGGFGGGDGGGRGF